MKYGIALLAVLLLASLLPFPGLYSPATPRHAIAGDGTCGEASSEPSRTWYFAEGYTGEGFQEWLCLFNPQQAACHLKLDILCNYGPTKRVEMDLPPRSRTSLDINALAGRGKEVSLSLEAGEPIVAERPMYFIYRGRWKGCTVTSGTTSLAQSWYFAEGCTRPGFEEWILLANPRDQAVPARVFLILEDGSTTPVSLDLPPHSRSTVLVNQAVGAGHDVGARVEADQSICAERVVYFNYRGTWPGGHASTGFNQPRKTYLFAEGCTHPGFEEWLCLYLPRESGSPSGGDVELKCLFPAGEERSIPVHLDPERRHTLNINQLVGEGKDVSLELKGNVPFLAERPMYFNYRGCCRGGHVSRGVESAGTKWYLAEGTTEPGFHEYLSIMNPGEKEAQVDLDIIVNKSGASFTERSQLTVAPRSRSTVNVNGWDNMLASGVDTSFELRSGQPIAAERLLYYPTTHFEVANAMDNLRHLSVGIGPRIEGTGGDEAAVSYLAGVLKNYGYEPVIQEVPLPNGNKTHNVIAVTNFRKAPSRQMPSPAKSSGVGMAEEYDTLVIGAHYDTRAGTGSPGANDNGSGTAVVLELARCFAETCTSTETISPQIFFVLFGGEELYIAGTDLHHFGSRYFVNALTPREKEGMGAIIVDMVGVGGQLYARTMGIGPMDLCNRLRDYASRTGIYLPYQVSGSYSDHEPFEKAGIPSVWLEVKDDPYYHTPADSYDKIVPAHIEQTGRLVEEYIRSTAGTLIDLPVVARVPIPFFFLALLIGLTM